MTPEGQTSRPPSKRRLALFTTGALIAASLLVVVFILPAEFHLDPLGVGRVTGLNQLAGPVTVDVTELPDAGQTARFYQTGFRTDTIDIPLDGYDGELEYKVRMKQGATLVYSFDVTGYDNPEWFYYDFHGEMRPAPEGEPPVVTEYRQATGVTSSGALVAPFDGVHGWYLQNQGEHKVVVHLHLAGFYTLIPPGDYGNEAGIEPVAVATP